MAKYWCYFLFLLWFSYLILSSVLLFTRGFLLSRVTLSSNSSCNTLQNCPPAHGHEEECSDNVQEHINSASHMCLPQKAKVVLLVVDALRYDFTLYDEGLGNGELAFQNKLPVMSRLLKESPDRTRLYKFVADPPTTTMQRLHALTTGSLPTFIDANSNFATAEISEDNVIDQLVKHKKDTVFIGDDTWTKLYPNRFTRSHAYYSFDTRDLDTVDIGVVTHLYPELKRNDFSLLVAHFLGVDHCGHRYGPYHSEMSRKLNEINEVIENVVNEVDNDTVVIVIGDHGMTETGDHGGSSNNEVTSAMFIHSKLPLKQMTASTDSIKQVDFVPTLSVILGVPIPFSNLGTVVLDAIPVRSRNEWKTLLFSLWANVQQVVTYIKEYSATTNIFKPEDMEKLQEKYAILYARVHTISSESDFERFAEDAKAFLVSLRDMCEEVWVQFDSFSISRGLLLLFLSLFFVYMIIDGIPGERLPEIIMTSFLVCSYVALLVAVGISCVLYYFAVVDDLLLNVYFSTGLMSLFMLIMLVIQNWEVIALHWYDRSKKNRIPNLILRLILIFSICGVFSNSYIIEESYVFLFLLITIIVFNGYGVNFKKEQKPKTGLYKYVPFALLILCCALVRISMYFWRCREEQQWCLASDAFVPHKSTLQPSKIEWTVSLFTLALLVTIIRIWLRSCGNLIGYSTTIFLARYTPTVMVVCTGGFWALHHLQRDNKTKNIPAWQVNFLPWMVYLLTSVGMISVVLKPLCVFVLPKKVGDVEEESVIPQLFRQVKELFNRKRQENDDVPVVCGLATVYSAAYVIVGVYLALLWALLLGDIIAPSAVLMFLSAILTFVTISISRIQKITNIDQLFEVPGSAILAVVILSHYFFYSSGHHPTFPNIAWEAAFVGTSGVFTYNFIPATLIIINTFGSYILAGLLLPLLLITPFSLFIMMPSIVPRKVEIQKDYSRGEIILYEKSGKLLKSVFILCCKYVTCHGIKVFASMLSSTIHCRHLMVWKIFAPKLIFESIAMLVTLASILVTYLLLIQVHRKVDRLVCGLNKQSR